MQFILSEISKWFAVRMFRAILNKSWLQHPSRHQLYGHLPPITKTIQVRRTRHAGHCWRSRDELISDVLLWTPTYGRTKAGRPARTTIQHLCEDTGCSLEELPEVMNDRNKCRERVRDIRASVTTWWWWCTVDVYAGRFNRKISGCLGVKLGTDSYSYWWKLNTRSLAGFDTRPIFFFKRSSNSIRFLDVRQAHLNGALNETWTSKKRILNSDFFFS